MEYRGYVITQAADGWFYGRSDVHGRYGYSVVMAQTLEGLKAEIDDTLLPQVPEFPKGEFFYN